MNRVDRLFALILCLQARRRVRACDLAAEFGVSERTIYRDMAALNEMGVPVVSLPGEGYELGEGYFLPPLLFTPAEAQALYLGGQIFCAHAEGQLSRSALDAMRKVTAALPAERRAELMDLAAVLGFETRPSRFDLDEPHLKTLQRAIREHRVVHIQYFGMGRNELSERWIEPQRLSYWEDTWYLTAFCRLRQEVRYFRLNRIESLELGKETFEPRPLAAPESGAGREVRLWFRSELCRWVRENQHGAFVREEPGAEGGVVMVYRVNDWDEIRSWLLSWGEMVVVLSPVELRQSLKEELEHMLQQLF